ncbi:uncharacterized protein LOC132727557 [Ruditapes philippinarum]|uniref:uncharacterized protein LOC132727557 n=1 Tax=Ruditapes philippinarum TaxID=129788 RepID=UPI00295B0DAA|nr:uncharacterized protein LOC132727557 [Ruditapes philippinarum]
MEMISKVFLVLALVNSIKMEDDLVFELFNSRLNTQSLQLLKVRRKQKEIEERIEHLQNVPQHDSNECCKELLKSIEDIQETGISKKEEDFSAMKRAISSEKEYVRNLVLSLEKTLENKGVILPKTASNGGAVKDFEKKIEHQTSITSNLSRQVELIGKTLDSVKSKSEGFESRLATIKTKSESIDKRIDTLETSMSSLILSSGKEISFSAQYKPQEGHVASIFKKGVAIPFRQVSYNDGEGFNESTGIFTVPVAGVYQFIFFVESWHQGDDSFTCQDAIVALFIDGKSVAAAVADPRHDKQFGSGGNVYINYFNKGQKVLVGTASTCEQYIIFGYRTTFSGFLLY